MPDVNHDAQSNEMKRATSREISSAGHCYENAIEVLNRPNRVGPECNPTIYPQP